MPPRQRALPTDFDSRLARLVAADGRQALGGMSRVGSGRGRRGNENVLANVAGEKDDGASNAPHLLVMAASADSIAPGGDHVTFDTVVERRGFDGVSVGPGDFWVHPVSGPYVATYEHTWDGFTGGGTVALELDGTVGADGVIATGDGEHGQWPLLYWAEAGQVGRILVTHADAGAQTCAAKIRVAMPEPATEASAFEGVRLLINGDLVAYAPGAITESFADPTVLVGELSGGTSSAFYDDVRLIQGGVNLLANSGFEIATAAWADPADVFGNWATHAEGAGSTARSTAQARTGTYSVDVDGVADVAYVLQDLSMSDGVAFELDLYVYPVTAGTQAAAVLFGWNRVNSSTASASVTMTASASSFNAFGLTGSGPPLPVGEWSQITLQVVV